MIACLQEDGEMPLTDEQWDRIKDALPGKSTDVGVTAKDNRLFVEAVLWVGRNGGCWRSLPHEYGNWNSVYKRFSRWSKTGVWQMIFNTLAVSPDTEWLMIDSTIVRAHQCAAGAKKTQAHKLLAEVGAAFLPKYM
jgi:transposase